MGRVAPGKSMLQVRRRGALERLIKHVNDHEDNEQLKRHLAEIDKLKDLVK